MKTGRTIFAALIIIIIIGASIWDRIYKSRNSCDPVEIPVYIDTLRFNETGEYIIIFHPDTIVVYYSFEEMANDTTIFINLGYTGNGCTYIKTKLK